MTTIPASAETRQGATPEPGVRSEAPPWASGIVTGIETAVLSAGLVFAFVFAATAAAPSADGSVSADWSGAWEVGTSFWLLAHGVPATAGGVTISLVPLGLTIVIGVIAASVAKRVAVPARSSVVWAALTYGAIAAIVSASTHGGAGPGWTAGIVGGAVTGVGTSLGLSRVHGFRFLGGFRLPEAVSKGVRLGAGLGAACLAVGAIQAIGWLMAGADQIAGVVDELSPDPAGGVTLAVGETAYLPTLSIWGLSWLSGAGFNFGSGTQYSPGGVESGPLPHVPLLAALPDEAWGWPFAGVVILVGLGALVGQAVRPWLPRGWAGGTTQAVAVVVVGFLIAGAAALASGSAGGESLADVGPDPVAMGWRTAVWIGVGLAVALVGQRAIDGVRVRMSRPRKREVPNSRAAPGRPPRTPENTDPLRLW